MPVRFLIADDMPAQQRLMANAVMFLGGESRFAATGHEALRLAEREPFDFILMDLQMPQLGGIAAASYLLHQWSGQAIRPRIMAVTGENPDDTYTLCRAVGMDGFINKPYSMTLLKKNLIHLLTQGHCWKEGPAERLLDLRQIDAGMRGRDEHSMAKAIKEARLMLLTMRTQFNELEAADLVTMANSVVRFAHHHGYVHLAASMKSLATAAETGDARAQFALLVREHDLFEVASQAALAWYRQPQMAKFVEAA
ncbi:CheY-like chemotaxis protein [Roseimicrobium gellanilyticum]|uniref:CheY-like chemotaxis protein n=1 Tax=Roseimicrobium gellanilyticum TaxID=748857 RepID=A0A366H2K3_9BACT|nr:response regulator [Roseimicrobium gellanilyticum]RBP36132.1 CheY-like chemotaxis protein [Roseimicrobium gellanilyticum]